MPYANNEDLPEKVRSSLPSGAQDIFRSAFNSAWEGLAKSGSEREESAFRIAWAAVKERYRKKGDRWMKK